MTMTRLEDMPVPEIITQESVKENIKKLNEIKAGLEQCKENYDDKMIEVIQSEIEIEESIISTLNPLQTYFEKAKEVSKMEKKINDEIEAVYNYYNSISQSITGIAFKKYSELVIQLKTNFSAYKKLKDELDIIKKGINPELEQFIKIYSIREKNNKVCALSKSTESRKENVKKMEAENLQRLKRISELESDLKKKEEEASVLFEKGLSELKLEKTYTINLSSHDEKITDKKHHSRPVSSISQKISSKRNHSKPIKIETKKELAQTTPQKKDIPITHELPNLSTNVYASLIDKSKIHLDDRSSITNSYMLLLKECSKAESTYESRNNSYNNITTSYNNNVKKIQAKVKEAQNKNGLIQSTSKQISTPVQEQQRPHNQPQNI